MKKISIIVTVGIPAHYGGFETLTKNNKNCGYFDTITIINCDSASLNKSFLA